MIRGFVTPIRDVPLHATDVRNGLCLRLEAKPAYLPTSAVRGRNPQRKVYVDSGRPRRKGTAMV